MTWIVTAAAALRTTDSRFPDVGPSEEEEDIACVLDDVAYRHGGADGGPCRGCGARWPCPDVVRGEALAVLWLGRAADRVAAHAHRRHL